MAHVEVRGHDEVHHGQDLREQCGAMEKEKAPLTGLGLRFKGWGFGVKSLELRVKGLGLR